MNGKYYRVREFRNSAWAWHKNQRPRGGNGHLPLSVHLTCVTYHNKTLMNYILVEGIYDDAWGDTRCETQMWNKAHYRCLVINQYLVSTESSTKIDFRCIGLTVLSESQNYRHYRSTVTSSFDLQYRCRAPSHVNSEA